MLELQALMRNYGGLAAVNNISFILKQGEILGLIGPNGAGKTTLVNLVSGMDTVTAGKVIFRGMDITHWPTHKRCAAGIARTFQNIRLFGYMDAVGNVLTARHLKIPAAVRYWQWLLPITMNVMREQQVRSMQCLERMGIAGLAARQASTLSYGDQRRVELARALATEPHLLLLDEPAAGMNAAETKELGNLILMLREQGITILVIEHDMNLINQVCDRVLVLNFGSLIADSTPELIKKDEQVIQAYLGTE